MRDTSPLLIEPQKRRYPALGWCKHKVRSASPTPTALGEAVGPRAAQLNLQYFPKEDVEKGACRYRNEDGLEVLLGPVQQKKCHPGTRRRRPSGEQATQWTV